MKKFYTQILAVALAILSFGLLLTACGESQITTIALKEGTYKTSYTQGEEVDTSGWVLVVKFDDNSRIELSADKFEIENFSAESEGTKEILVSYLGRSIKVSITVGAAVNQETLTVVGYDEPDFLSLYNSNREEKMGTKRNEFMVRDNPYLVGFENPFIMSPKVTLLTEDLDIFIVGEPGASVLTYESKIEVRLIEEGSQPTLLTGEELDRYVTIEANKGSFQFKSDASGKTFNIKMYPKEYIVDADFENEFIEHTFTVVDAWNAYGVSDLVRMDKRSGEVKASHVNTGITGPSDYWADYKVSHGITGNINGLVLHNNINVVRSDIPDKFFYNGSLLSRATLFAREVALGETFLFEGNYFSINATDPAFIQYYADDDDNGERPAKEGEVSSVTCLFDFNGDSSGMNWRVLHGNVTIQNLRMKGNANRDDTHPENMGGLIGIKIGGEVVKIDNCLMDSFTSAVSFYKEDDEALFVNDKDYVFNMTNSKAYDSFSNMFYLWNANVLMFNCDFAGSGGPMFIAVDSKKDDDIFPTITLTDCNIKTELVGQEAWFKGVGAEPLVGMIDSLSGLLQLNSQGLKSLKDSTNHFNIVGVLMPIDPLDAGEFRINGKIDFKKTVAEQVVNEFSIDFEDHLFRAVAPASVPLPPIFRRGNSVAYFDGKSLICAVGSFEDLFSDAHGKYIGVYMGLNEYLGIMLELFPATPPAA